jgi:cytochrome c551/c552
VPEPPAPPKDPITTRSLSGALLAVGVILLLVLAWSLYQEEYGLRPWRGYQRRFAAAYAPYLAKQVAKRKAEEAALQKDPQWQKLQAAILAAQQVAEPERRAIEARAAVIEEQRESLLDAFVTGRSLVGALTYDYESVPSTPEYAAKKKARFDALMKARKKSWKIDWPTGEGKTVVRSFDYVHLNDEFSELLDKKAVLLTREGEIEKPVKDAQDKLNAYVAQKLPGLDSGQLDGLLNKVRSMDVELRQIYIYPPGQSLNYAGGGTLADRCQSCHVAMDPEFVAPTVTLTKADLGLAGSHDAPFTSHPEPELLKLHPLANFGCSPCHGGNGRGLDSVTIAHGRYEHWPWPLFYPENYDAGCQQCHSLDMRTEFAPVLNRGRELFREKGCMGCHQYANFDSEAARLQDVQREIARVEDQIHENETIEIPRLNKMGDQAPTNQLAQQYYARAQNLTVADSRSAVKVDQLDDLSRDLLLEVKTVGPDLKEVRMKLNKDWIPYWLEHTHQWRPTTHMPQFRFAPGEAQAIAAFVWQDAIKGPALPSQPPGDAAHGKQLFDERGCLACHSIGEGSQRIGGDFAANLTREGEKANYDYLVRWIYNPRLRTRPYCPSEKRDLGPEDYAKHGLPFVFDLDHSRCPDDGHELEVEQPTVMPSFRLSWQDARDIASFLMTQKNPNDKFPAAPYMEDPKLFAEGKALVRFYGCAGCHEIAGLEDAGRIGTELTDEGSKPLDRFDFGFLLTDSERGILPDGKISPRGPWHDVKGFLDEKLAHPGIFDRGRYRPNPHDRLHMPQPNVTQADINALTTMLLGSTSQMFAPSYLYRPAGREKAIEEGWWIVSKYNCMGCHQVDIGQKSVLETLPMYQGENSGNLPPVLTFEGARVNPNWLKRFLANPALSTADTDRNGVRTYLQVRMPTFFLSKDEIRKLVAFFEAESSQPQHFIPQKLTPLTPQEREIARAIFTSPAAPCLKCHATGVPAHDKLATAPNFLLASERLRPEWTKRWIVTPAKMAPGTAMPSGLFRFEDGRWVFNGPLPAIAKDYKGDEADLLVRYMFELTPEEQRALLSHTPAPPPGGGK